jgi:hypothetical protein
VVDDSLHRPVELGARGRGQLRVHVLEVAGRHLVHQLLDDLHGFAHLGYAHSIARVDIAFGRDRDPELHVSVRLVRHVAAEVPVDARRARDRPGGAQRARLIGGDHTDTLGAFEEDGVLREQRLVLVETLGHDVGDLAEHPVPPDGQVLPHSPRDDVTVVHAQSRDHLVEVEDRLPFAEPVEHRRHGAHVEALGSPPHEMRRQAVDLRHQGSDVHTARWDLDA